MFTNLRNNKIIQPKLNLFNEQQIILKLKKMGLELFLIKDLNDMFFVI